MKALNTLFLAVAFFGASAAVQAADTTFAGVTYGQTSDKIKKSGLLSSNTDPLKDRKSVG